MLTEAVAKVRELSGGSPWNAHRLSDFGENGEVQENLNFSLHDFKVFAILRTLSGKRRGVENCER